MPDHTDPIRTHDAGSGSLAHTPGAASPVQLHRSALLSDELKRFAESITPHALRGRIDADVVVQDSRMRLHRRGMDDIEDRGPGSLARYLRQVVRSEMADPDWVPGSPSRSSTGEFLAAVHAELRCLTTYPSNFLAWLAGWLAH